MTDRATRWLENHPIREIAWEGDTPVPGDLPWMPCGNCGEPVMCDACRERIERVGRLADLGWRMRQGDLF